MLMFPVGLAGKDVGSNPNQIKLSISINHCHNLLNVSPFLVVFPHRNKALSAEGTWTVT
jgi:hypothetical protein